MKSEGAMSDDRRNWRGSVLGEKDGGGVDVGDVDGGSDGIVETNIE